MSDWLIHMYSHYITLFTLVPFLVLITAWVICSVHASQELAQSSVHTDLNEQAQVQSPQVWFRFKFSHKKWISSHSFLTFVFFYKTLWIWPGGRNLFYTLLMGSCDHYSLSDFSQDCLDASTRCVISNCGCLYDLFLQTWYWYLNCLH